MHESKRQINDVLAPLLKESGYQKQNLTWHKRTQDTILVLHIEKNRWGANNYTIHLGIYLRSLGDELTPPFYRCPLQAFMEELVQDKGEYRRVLDFANKAYELNERLNKIGEFVSTTGLTWLESYSSLADLKHLAQDDPSKLLPRVFMTKDVHHYLCQVV